MMPVRYLYSVVTFLSEFDFTWLLATSCRVDLRSVFCEDDYLMQCCVV